MSKLFKIRSKKRIKKLVMNVIDNSLSSVKRFRKPNRRKDTHVYELAARRRERRRVRPSGIKIKSK